MRGLGLVTHRMAALHRRDVARRVHRQLGRPRPVGRLFLCGLAWSIILGWALLGCTGSRPETVTFDGRQYTGVATDRLIITSSELQSVGSAASLDAGHISHRTVFRIHNVAISDALVMIRDDGEIALFVAKPIEQITALCDYAVAGSGLCGSG